MAADSELELLIRTLSDTAGAEKVQEALDKVKGSTTEVTGATEEQSDATSKLDTNLNVAANSLSILTANKRVLNTILHTMGHGTIPTVAKGLLSMLKGPLGPALALGVAFSFIKKHLEEVNTELDAMGTKMAESMTGRLEINRQKVIQLTDAYAKLRAEMNEPVKWEGRSRWLEEKLKELEQDKKHQDALDAEKASKTGVPETVAQKNAKENAYGEKRLAVMREEAKNAEGLKSQLEDEAKVALAAAGEATAKKKSNAEELAKIEAQLADKDKLGIQARLEAAEQSVKEWKNASNFFQSTHDNPVGNLEKLKAEQGQLIAQKAELEKNTQSVADRAAEAEAASARASGKVTLNKGLVESTNKTVRDEEFLLRRERITNYSEHPAELEGVVSGYTKHQTKDSFSKLKQVLMDHGASTDEVIRIATALAGHQITIAQEVNYLKKREQDLMKLIQKK